MRATLFPIIISMCTCLAFTSTSLAEPLSNRSKIQAAVAWVQLDTTAFPDAVRFDADSLLMTSTSCGSQLKNCADIKLEGVPFESNGIMNISIVPDMDCRADFQLPFTVRDNNLETPSTSYSAKWRASSGGDSSLCPSSTLLLTVLPPTSSFDAYKVKVVENK